MNPTCDVLEKRMAALEGGAAAGHRQRAGGNYRAILTIHMPANIISATAFTADVDAVHADI